MMVQPEFLTWERYQGVFSTVRTIGTFQYFSKVFGLGAQYWDTNTLV